MTELLIIIINGHECLFVCWYSVINLMVIDLCVCVCTFVAILGYQCLIIIPVTCTCMSSNQSYMVNLIVFRLAPSTDFHHTQLQLPYSEEGCFVSMYVA